MRNDYWRPLTLLLLFGLILWIPEGCHNSVTTEVLVFEEAPPNFQPGISIALALATIASENVLPEPVPTPNGKTKCTNCDGRGKVGDGRTMIECPVCEGKGFVEPKREPVIVAPPVPSTPEQKEPVGRRRVLFFTAEWCGPCQQVKPHLAWYESAGWKTGWTRDCHIQLVDIDKDPGAKERYKAYSIPVFVLVDATGKELARTGWSGDRMVFANLLNGKPTVEPPAAPPAEEPPSPIQTYEVPREWIPQPPPMTARERALQRYQQRKAELEQRRAERRARYGR